MTLLQIQDANLNNETLRFVSIISGIIIMLLLGIIAHFLKKRNDLIDDLSREVIILTKNLAVLNRYIEDCIPDLKKEIGEIKRKIESQGEDLIRIRAHLGVNGKNKKDE